MLRTAKVEESGEQLVAANHFDKEILLEKATIGLFPYGNGKDYVKVRESVAKKLRDVNQNIMALGKKDKKDYRLNVCYGFRKKDIQKRAFCEQRTKMAEKRMPYDSIYEFVEEIHRFIAVPTVAGHPTGGAVDVTIKDVGNDRFLDMGSLIYEFSSDKVRWDAKGLTLEQKINRQLLFNLITSAGFAPFWGEWWHYSYGDREWAVFYDKPVAIYEQIDL
jgi:D-alanyl-D-alanine dipeptidase